MSYIRPMIRTHACVCATLLLLALNARAETLQLFVAPNGDDCWTGGLAEPNAERTDGPLATPLAARNAVRKLKQAANGTLTAPVTIILRGGTYPLAEPLVLTTEDSGTAEAPVTWAAWEKDKPVVSGGRRITGWRPENWNGKNLWVADLPPEFHKVGRFQNLWVNGRRAVRARHPNSGYFGIAAVPDRTLRTQWQEGQSRFELQPGSLPGGATLAGAEAVVMTLWAEWHVLVASYDPIRRLVNTDRKTGFAMQSGDLVYFEGSLDALDAPGEWALDEAGARLLYLPKPGEEMGHAEVVAPVLDRLLSLEGLQSQGKFVDHVRFRGLTFSHSEWRLPPGQSGFVQGAFGVPAAVYATGARYCEWVDCTFSQLGQFAFELCNGCWQNLLVRCHMHDLGAGGVKLGDGTWANTVADCRIHDGGRRFHGAVGILSMESHDDRIIGNAISDFYYTAIALGWTWGYGANKAKNILVENNRISWLGKLSAGDGPILNELGGIYVLGKQPGTVLRGNVIEHVEGRTSNWENVPSGFGVFLDEGASYLLIEDNIIHNCDINLHQHYGRENVIRRNLLAFPGVSQLSRVRQEPHLSFTITNNIFLTGPEAGLLLGNWSDTQFVIDHNLYWRTDGGEAKFGNLTIAEWQAKGRDTHSLVADPLFVDAAHGDFRLRPESPARQADVGPPAIRETERPTR